MSLRLEVSTQEELDAIPIGNIAVVRNGPFVARGSSHVVAWGSSHVEAWESSHVVASDLVAVHKRDKRATVEGGVLIDVSKLNLTTSKDWLTYHGITVDKGIAVLYKAVDDDYRSGNGFTYAPGTAPEAPDWKNHKSCGNGLHLVAHPTGGLVYFPGATRFVACRVRVSKMVVIDEHKVKVPRIEKPGCIEVDRYGELVKT